MGLFHTTDEKLANELARMAAERDLGGLARKLAAADDRWCEGAAELLYVPSLARSAADGEVDRAITRQTMLELRRDGD